MDTLEFGTWKLVCDAPKTAEAYTQIESGGAERCGCASCRNFAAVREQIYPPQMLFLFSKLGIDFRREAESYHMARIRPGRHHYGAWFHFIGKIVAAEDPIQLTPQFSTLLLTKGDLAAKAFAGQALVQVEIYAEVPWVLAEPEPER